MDAELFFSVDVTRDDAPQAARQLTDWLVASGWALPSLAPGPRAFETDAATLQSSQPIVVISEPTLNMQGVDMEEPLCPFCSTAVDFERLTDEISDENPYPVVSCESCGREVAYLDWIGTAHPIMSNLTLELEYWSVSDNPPCPLFAEIRAQFGGRWLHIQKHW